MQNKITKNLAFFFLETVNEIFSLRKTTIKTTMLNVTDKGFIQKIAENYERKSQENFEKV